MSIPSSTSSGQKKVEVDPLRDAAATLKSDVLQQFQSALSTISSANEALQGQWQGDSSEAFVKAFLSLQVSFQSRIADLEERINAMEESIDLFVTWDQDHASLFQE